MKRMLLKLFAVGLLLLFSSIAVSAQYGVKVFINDELIDFSDYGVEPQIISGRTMVPMRTIFEALGASVEWNDAEKKVKSVKDEATIELTIGKKYLIKNGNIKEIDVPAMIVDSRTLVPIRAVSEALGCDVEWNEETKTVFISYDADSHETVDFENGQDELDDKQEDFFNHEGKADIVFDFLDGADSFIAAGGKAETSEGIMKFVSEPHNVDPQIVNPNIKINTENYKTILVRFKYDNYLQKSEGCRIFFCTDASQWFSEDKTVCVQYKDCYVDAEGYTWGRFDLGSNNYWKGTCTALRFDPADAGAGRYEIDKIVFVYK